MDIDPQLIDAEVHYGDLAKDFFYVKIIFGNTGLYINSFTVKRSKRDGQPWVERPKFQQGNKWRSHVDFDKSSELWRIIEQKAIKAVEDYKAEQDRLNGIDIDKPLTVDDLALWDEAANSAPP